MTSRSNGGATPSISSRPLAHLSEVELVHLIHGFHAAHLADLAAAVRLSRVAEAHHGAEAGFPIGLSGLLEDTLEKLRTHQEQEETVLFPLILSGRGDLLTLPVAALGSEHGEAQDGLERLVRMTRDYTPPPQACRTWRALYELCRKFDEEFREHLHLEEHALFPRFS